MLSNPAFHGLDPLDKQHSTSLPHDRLSSSLLDVEIARELERVAPDQTIQQRVPPAVGGLRRHRNNNNNRNNRDYEDDDSDRPVTCSDEFSDDSDSDNIDKSRRRSNRSNHKTGSSAAVNGDNYDSDSNDISLRSSSSQRGCKR